MIGSLPDNQKAILYSLLCYDGNQISWRDSDQWLSTLNDIREKLFDAENVSVTDTKHDIDKLKSIKLIQNNDRHLKITSKKYVEDAMYEFGKSTNSKFSNHSYMLTLLCMTIVRDYCTAWSRYRDSKHVYCVDGLYPSLVYRLQMDILIHPTIEDDDWGLQKAASWILNIPTDKLQSEKARKRMYRDLRRDIDKGDIKKLGVVSWTRMTREEENIFGPKTVYELRPQCAISSIGQHDHNDIFIMEGEMFAVKGGLPTFNGDFEDLFAVLISDRFSVPFDELYIFDGITEQSGSVVRFISDEIRHQVMYSYVVRKLLTDDDMKNFIRKASVDCLMEYGRLCRYSRKEQDPCLFIPEDMENLYLEKQEPCLFIPEDIENLYFERLGYAAITHVLFDDKLLQNTTRKIISEINDIPFDLCIQSKNFRNRFVEYVRNERGEHGGEVQSLKYMYSAFLFHNMDIFEENINSIRNSDISTWPVLLGILMSDGYKIKNDIATTPMVKGRFLNISADQYNKALEEIKSKRNIVEINEEHVTFASPGIKHAVMCRFVESCLKSDEDLESYIEESSTDSLMEYCRLWSYKLDEKEACLFIPEKIREKYIKRLNQNVITHVMVEDRADSDGERRAAETRKYISEHHDIPFDLCIQSKIFRNQFVKYVRNERGELGGEVQSLKYMYSAFLFHNMDIFEENINSIRNLDIWTWPVLLGILMSDGYKIKNDIATTPMVKGRFLNISADQYNKSLEEIKSKRNIVEIIEEHVTFASPGIKHAVMCRFVESCLKSDEDLESYIEESSTDSLMEYCRLWSYKRDEKEACLFIPEKFREKYIKRLNQNVITHVMVEDRDDSDRGWRTAETRKYISEFLNIPLEVLSWDIGGRRRYLETIKMGKKKMYRARGMLVGCTGAGKTTLLQRLQSRHTTQTTETTKGLEIHDNLFEIVSDTLKDHPKKSAGLHSDKQLISMTDFAGQATYYACHQVYLSRRAFYLLVVDMSKKLTKEAHEDNTDRHNPIGSLFHHWTYKDYFTFWLQCIQTYCGYGDRRTVGNDTETVNRRTVGNDMDTVDRRTVGNDTDTVDRQTVGNDMDTVDRRTVDNDMDTVDRRNPVILIASHKDKAKPKTYATKLAFFEKLKSCIPQQQALENLLSPDRYYEIECPRGSLTEKREEMIEEVKKCIVQTVRRLPHWGEEIPLSWVDFEDILKQKKAERVWKRSTLKDMEELQPLKGKELEIDDMLRFFHEIGQIIYFPDKRLRDVIIIDVQWFVDGFKNIITDENHFAREIKDCDKKIERGRIAVSTLKDIWSKAKNKSYIDHMHEIVPYMEKLGLMAKIKKSKEFYIPSMNKVDISPVDLDTINDGQKTSILIFHFKTYLPHFFFFRLVVHCFEKMDVLKEDMFSKNAAFYKDKDHFIAIAVNKTSIQLQVFTESRSIQPKTECVIEIREKVKSIIRDLTKTFHNKVTYDIGYSCKDINITDEDKDYFLVEDEILPRERGKEMSERKCPRHPKADEKHYIKPDNLLRFWNNTGGT